MGFRTFDLGLIEFGRAWSFQKEIFSRVKNEEFDAALIFCRHRPVITLGRKANRRHILVSEEELASRGIGVYEIERGGDITYHGPGQLMVYPVFNLACFKKDINWYLRCLEEIAVATLSKFSITACRRNGLTGVWAKDKKIASIGIAIKNWVTCHGLAINVKKDDLANFSLIRPCGMDIMMTSMETVLNKELCVGTVKKIAQLTLQNELNSKCQVGREMAR